jgi:hypothetical protein
MLMEKSRKSFKIDKFIGEYLSNFEKIGSSPIMLYREIKN